MKLLRKILNNTVLQNLKFMSHISCFDNFYNNVFNSYKITVKIHFRQFSATLEINHNRIQITMSH